MKKEQLYKLVNNTLITPPITGSLSTGDTVSGYHLQPASILKAEGWKPLVVGDYPVASDEPAAYDEGVIVVEKLEDKGDYILRSFEVQEVEDEDE